MVGWYRGAQACAAPIAKEIIRFFSQHPSLSHPRPTLVVLFGRFGLTSPPSHDDDHNNNNNNNNNKIITSRKVAGSSPDEVIGFFFN
jgi:hypothetical protein